jgi:Bacterial Ig domain/Immunoglobulin I-set domain/Immunoglobulin domain
MSGIVLIFLLQVAAQSATLLPLINPGFEANHFTNYPGYILDNGSMTGWFSSSHSGVNPIADGRSPFADNGAIPEGTQVAFIQGNGSLLQSLGGFVVGGIYQLVYAENACAQCGATPSVSATMNGLPIVASHPVSPVGSLNAYTEIRSIPFVANTASMDMSIVNNSTASNATVLIDNVRVVLISATTASQTLVPAGSTWSYLDNGSDLGTAWQAIGFDASSWRAGPAQLGYGDGDERTVIGFGPNSGSKYITTYFRRSFVVDSPSSFINLTVRLLRDDGGIVYLNGVEIFRSNMPQGFINAFTVAATTIPNSDENVFFGQAVDPSVLMSGTNVLAVEIHQANGTSSDISFDLDLVGTVATGPPAIIAQPQSPVTAIGGSATFRVKAMGAPPLSYQWYVNDTVITGATNSLYTVFGVTTRNKGRYSVEVSNSQGSVRSDAVPIRIIEFTGENFQITGLSSNNARSVEHLPFTGNDRGGMAASLNELFITGDSSTARFSLGDLSGGASLGRIYDGLFSDLQTGRAFLLGTNGIFTSGPGTNGLPSTGQGSIDSLVEINPDTGELTTNVIALSSAIDLSGCSGCMGVFSGFGRAVIYNGSNAFLISLPSGAVENLGAIAISQHSYSESWAYWGVAEFFGGANWITYVRDYQTIVRTRLPDGLTLPVASFTDLGDMANFTVSPLLKRWYFHYQYNSQFGYGNELAGYADATFAYEGSPQPPTILQSSLDRRVPAGSNVTLTVVAGGFPLAYQWQFNGEPIPDATNASVVITSASAKDVGLYSVVVSNGLGIAVSSPSLLDVTSGGGSLSAVAVLGADPLNIVNDVVERIRSTEMFGQVDGFSVMSGPAPPLSQLMEYDAVLLFSDYSFSDPVSLGNVLADYIDSGHGVVINTFAFSVPLQGRIVSGGYLPFSIGGYTTGFRLSLVADDATHPILDSVGSFNGGGSSYHNSGIVPTSGSQLIAHWSDGLPLVAVKQVNANAVVGLNFYPPSSAIQSGFWDISTDGELLMANALQYAAGGGGDTVPLVSPGIRRQPQNATVLQGLNAAFNVTAYGSPVLSYQWLFNGEPLSNATNRSLLISGARTNQTGAYAVVITNAYGSVTSAVAVLTVQPTRGLAAYYTDYNPQSVGPVYSITNSGFTPLQVQNFTDFNISAADVIVLNESSGGPSTDLRRRLPALRDWVNSGGKLIVHQRYFNSDTFSPNPFLLGNPATRLTNFINGGTSDINVIPPSTLVTAGPHGVITDASLDNGPFGMSSFIVRSTLPVGSTAVLSGGGDPSQVMAFSYQLGNGVIYFSALPLDYYLDYGGDFTALTRDVYLPNVLEYVARYTNFGAPSIISQPAGVVVTEGSSANLFASVSGKLPLSYQWFFNGAPLGGAVSNPLVLSQVSTNDAGNYFLVVTNTLGRATSSVASVKIVPRFGVGIFEDFKYVRSDSPPNLEVNLKDIGHSVFPFTSLFRAFTNDVILVPEIVNNPLDTQIDATTRALLQAFVLQGGVLVAQGANYTPGFLNSVFDFSIYSPGNYTGIDYLRTSQAAGTPFTNAPTRVPANYYTAGLNRDSLPPGALTIFGNTDYNFSAVTLIPYGAGAVIHLGWNWSDAAPLGSQDGGWIEILADAIQCRRGTPHAARFPVPLVPVDAVWRYSDEGLNLGTGWRSRTFDDGSWRGGAAPLGYGRGDEATVVGFGPDPNHKFITTYFRTSFVLSNAAALSNVTVRFVRDDSLALYLNGTEIVRDCLYPDAGFDTPAACNISGAGEDQFVTYQVPSSLFVNGTNVLAAEVHQVDPTSSDMIFELELTALVAASAPVIRTQPQSQTLREGQTAFLSVVAAGSLPLTYQWRLDDLPILSATNALLVLSGLNSSQSGDYSVVVSNTLGRAVSRAAHLEFVPIAGETFKIVNLTTNHALAIDVGSVGPIRGGIGIGSENLLYPGSSGLTPFDLADLSGTNLYPLYYDALATDLKTEIVYTLGNGTNAISFEGGFVTSLLELDGRTGGLTGRRIDLSQPVNLRNPLYRSGEVGIFSGVGRVILYNGVRAWHIDLPSGKVVDLGPTSIPTHMTPAVWAYWGIVEFWQDALWLVYVRDGQSIARTRIPDGATSTIASFGNLGQMSALSLSVPLNRWYFHHQYSSEFDPFYQALGFADATFASSLPVTPPSILKQPQDQEIASSGTVTFNVAAKAIGGVSYQWMFNNTALPGATNSTLTLFRVNTNNAGLYSVRLSNNLDSVQSSNAVLTVVPLNGDTLRIAKLSTDGVTIVNDYPLAGDDRGALAVSRDKLFYSGDAGTATFDIADLSGGTRLNGAYDVLISDLATERLFVLGAGTNIGWAGQPITTLLEVDGRTGELTGSAISLSEPIQFNGQYGLFAGLGRIVVFDGTRVQSIEVPSGRVLDFGPMTMPQHALTEIGGFWGIAEFFNDSVWLVYVRDNQTIVRTRVPDGLTQNVATFNYLGDMAAITVSLPFNRWYFHHQYSSQFSSYYGTSGFADAELVTSQAGSGPEIVKGPRDQSVALSGTVRFEVTARGSAPLSYQWLFEGNTIARATNASLMITNVTLARAGKYSVVVSNSVGVVTSEQALMRVIPSATVRVFDDSGSYVYFEHSLNIRSSLQRLGHQPITFTDFSFATARTNIILFPALEGGDFSQSFAQTNRDALAAFVARGGVLVVLGSANDFSRPARLLNSIFGFSVAGGSIPSALALTPEAAGTIFANGPASLAPNSYVSSLVSNSLPPGAKSIYSDGSQAAVTIAPFGSGKVVFLGWNWSDAVPEGRQDGGWLQVLGSAIEGAIPSPAAPEILRQPQNQVNVAGSTARMRVVAAGYPLAYQWLLNGQRVSGATNYVMELKSVTTAQAGAYSVLISNALGQVTSATADLTVVPPLLVGVFTDSRFVDTSGNQYSESDTVRASLTQLGHLVRPFTTVAAGATNQVMVFPYFKYGDPHGTIDEAQLRSFVASGGMVIMHGGYYNVLLLNTAFGISLSPYGYTYGSQLNRTTEASGTSFGNGPASLFANGNTYSIYSSSLSPLGPRDVYRDVFPDRSVVAVVPYGSGNIVFLGWDWWNAAPMGTQDGGWLETLGNAVLARVGISSMPPVITLQPEDNTVLMGLDASFQVRASGNELKVQWFRDAQILPGATNVLLNLVNLQTNQSGGYFAVVSNTSGSVTSRVAMLEVRPTKGIVGYYADNVSFSGTVMNSIQAAGFTPLPIYDVGGFDFTRVDLLMIDHYSDPPTSSAVLARLMDVRAWVLNGGRLVIHDWLVGSNVEHTSPVLFGSKASLSFAPGNSIELLRSPENIVATGPFGSLTDGSLNNGSWSFDGYASRQSLPSQALPLLADSSDTNHIIAFSYAFGNGAVYWSSIPLENLIDQSGPLGANIRSIYLPNVLAHCDAISAHGAPLVVESSGDITVLAGSSPSLGVAVIGEAPVQYQWYSGAEPVAGANGPVLSLPNVTTNQAGVYTVLINNAFGSVTATSIVTVVQPLPFRITGLLPNSSFVLDHTPVTGDDRGGIAVSATHLYYTGDQTTGRFSATNLVGGTNLPIRYDALVSDLRTEKIYSLVDGTNLVTGPGRVTGLLELNAATGLPTANRIDLSSSVELGSDTGIFAGYGAVVLVTASHGYRIEVPSGLVIDLGAVLPFQHQSCESWAYWGVSEFFDGSVHIDYVQDSQTIARMSLPSGVKTNLSTFSYLGDMCSFTVSVPRTRWYFHYQGSSQFGDLNEAIGFALATFDRPPRIVTAIPNRTITEDSTTGPISFTIQEAETRFENLLVAASVSNPGLFPATNVVLAGTNSNRTITLTPAHDQFGTSVVNIVVTDSIGQASNRTFVVTVSPINDAPFFTPGTDVSVLEDAGSTLLNWASGIAAGPTNEADQTLTFRVTNNLPSLFAVQPAVAPGGHLAFTPAADASGTAIVSVRLTDNGGTENGGQNTSAERIFNISIAPVNDPPGFTPGSDITVPEDFGVMVIPAWATNIRPGPSDEASQKVLFAVQTTNPELFLVAPTISSDGTLAFTPGANANGSAIVTVRVQDDGGTANGGIDTSAPQTFVITVEAINDPPVAISQSLTVIEDHSLAITLRGSDPDGDPLTFSIVTAPIHGTLSGSGSNLVYQPDTNFFGADSFTFRASDQQLNSAEAVVAINVTPENDAPLANAQALVMDEDSTALIELKGSDVDGDALTFSIATGPAHGILTPGSGQSYVYSPSTNFFGTDTFTFRANDGQLDSAEATVSITILPINDSPVAYGQTVTARRQQSTTISLNGYDVDGDTLAYSVIDLPLHGTLSGSGSIRSYLPAPAYSGADSFTFVVSDGVLISAVATVNISITSNAAPVARIAIVPFVYLTPDATNGVVISPNNQTATATLDGRGSSDPEHDPLTFAWFEGGASSAFASVALVTNIWSIGRHPIRLLVSDVQDSSSSTALLEIISSADAVRQLIALIDRSPLSLKFKRQLMHDLQQAVDSFEKRHFRDAIRELQQFLERVDKQIERQNPSLAAALQAGAQMIIDAQTFTRLKIFHDQPNGHWRFVLDEDSDCTFTLETSLDLIHWSLPSGIIRLGPKEWIEKDLPSPGPRFYRAMIHDCKEDHH